MKIRFVLICVIVSMMSLLFFGWYSGSIWFVYPDREKYPVMGIDISHYQSITDWEKLKSSDISFIYMKASEGDDWIDSQLEENYMRARSVNIPIGMYHFYSLRISGEKQLENIIRVSSGKTWDLPIVIDLEFVGNSQYRPSQEDFQKNLQVLLSGVEKYQGKKPILYTTYDFIDTYLGDTYQDYPIWIRDIFGYPDRVDWTIWQYKDRGSIDGIEGFVDLNVLSGSLESLIQ